MSSDETSVALSNLASIKNGDDPRDSPEESQSKPLAKTDDALELVRAEMDRLFDDHRINAINRCQVHCAVARWDGRNGYCKYNVLLGDKRRFNKRITQTTEGDGHHVVAINEKILEQGNREDFLDTVRHELAHAVCYEAHGKSQKHNHRWKKMASKLGADPSSCHSKRDRSDEFDYYISCPNPNCDMQAGKTKRSKVIKRPFNRKCSVCGESTLVSHDAGTPAPTENGTVAVESLDWDNEREWIEAGRP